MVLGPLFETGSMTGLMLLSSRHSRLMTNFKIYRPESRPNRPAETARGGQVCGGPTGPGVPVWTRVTGYIPLVGPWQYQSTVGGYYTGYYPSPTDHCTARCHHRCRTLPRATTRWESAPTCSLGSTKEILGVDNALLDTGSWIPHSWTLDPGYWILYTGN